MKIIIITVVFILCLCSVSTVKAESTWMELEHKSNIAYDATDFVKALFYAKKALSLHPKNVVLLTNMGNIERELSNYNTSMMYFKKALSIENNHIAALVGMGSSLAAIFSLDNATYFKKAVSVPIYGNSTGSMVQWEDKAIIR